MSTSNVEAVEVKKEDRRVRKTKRLLRSALTDLLKEKPIQEIKVREIAEVIRIFMENLYPLYRDNPRVDILLNNTDFGVGGEKDAE